MPGALLDPPLGQLHVAQRSFEVAIGLMAGRKFIVRAPQLRGQPQCPRCAHHRLLEEPNPCFVDVEMQGNKTTQPLYLEHMHGQQL